MSVSLPPILELQLHLTDEQFWQLCRDNSDLRFERTVQGEVIIMSPTGGTTSKHNADLTANNNNWKFPVLIKQ